jgi:purine-nucleoside phosphorylase
MEASALYTFARTRGVPALCLAHVANMTGQTGDDFENGQAAGTEDALAIVETLATAKQR